MQDQDLTGKIIGCAYEVYNTLGGGFAESVYEKALGLELRRANLDVQHQVKVPVYYKETLVGDFTADLLVEHLVIVELKAIEQTTPAHEVQLVNYLAATRRDIGLLINFSPARGVQVKRRQRTLPHHRQEK